MCTGFELAALAASAAGTAISVDSANNAADRQQSIINSAADESSRLNEKKAGLVESYTKDIYDPTKRADKQEQAITRQESSLVDALEKAGGGSIADTQGRVSEDYLRAKASSTAAGADDILRRARIAARNSGASLLFNDEATTGANLSSDIAGINSQDSRQRGYASNAVSAARDRGSLVGGLLQAGGAAAGSYAARQ